MKPSVGGFGEYYLLINTKVEQIKSKKNPLCDLFLLKIKFKQALVNKAFEAEKVFQ